MAHRMAGGSYCAIIRGAVAFKGARRDALRRVKEARRGNDPRAFVGLWPSGSIGQAWP